MKIDEEKQRKIEIKLNNIKTVQKRYPWNIQDYTEYNNLIRTLHTIEDRRTVEMYAKNYFDDLVVIYQGNMLKYGRSTKNNKAKKLKDGH